MKNEIGAIICTYCNTPFDKNNQNTLSLHKIPEQTGTLPEYFDDILDAPIYNPDRFMDFEIPDKGIVLINIETGQPITMQEEKAFILGRTAIDNKPKEYLVDLTPLDAINLGISRVHAMIRETKDGYQIIDMESSNGTWLENERLVPKKIYPLESGSRIRLGRLNILVFYP